MTPLVRGLSLTAVALSLLAWPRVGGSVSEADTSPVFFAAHGKCALQYRDGESRYCRASKFGNSFLPSFSAPRPGEWGIAYAYNCGAKPRYFGFSIDLKKLFQRRKP